MAIYRDIRFPVAGKAFEPLFTLRHPETGKRPSHIVLHSGRGCAKSVTIAQAVLYHGRRCRMRIVVARQFGNTIDESAKAELESAALQMGIHDEWDWQERKITHRTTGTQITFMGLERNRESIRGLAQVDLVWCEEAQTINQETLDILIPTIRKKNSIIIYSLNPRLKSDPVANTFIVNSYPNSLVIALTRADNRFFTERLQADMEAMRAIDPVRARCVWDGEFMGAEDNTLILPQWVEASRTRFPIWTGYEPKLAGVDVARMGGDESWFILRQGSRIIAKECFGKGDTHDVGAWIEQMYYIHQPDGICIDATGSAGQFDYVRRRIGHLIPVIDYIGSQSPFDPIYLNSRIECWGRMADWIRDDGQLIDGFNNLSVPKYKYNTSDKKQLQSKEQIKAEIGRSPDEEDALSLTFHPYLEQAVKLHKERKDEMLEEQLHLSEYFQG